MHTGALAVRKTEYKQSSKANNQQLSVWVNLDLLVPPRLCVHSRSLQSDAQIDSSFRDKSNKESHSAIFMRQLALYLQILDG